MRIARPVPANVSMHQRISISVHTGRSRRSIAQQTATDVAVHDGCGASSSPCFHLYLCSPPEMSIVQPNTPSALQQQQQRRRSAALFSSVAVLPLCGLAAVAFGARLLLRRRRQLVSGALEQQALHLQHLQDHDRCAISGGSTAGKRLTSGARASLVRRTRRDHVAALLSAVIGSKSHGVQLVAWEAVGVAHELGQGALLQSAGDSTSGRIGRAPHAASQPGSVWPPPSMELTSRLQQSRDADAADAAALHWRWSLPTESLRMPSGSLEVRLCLTCHGRLPGSRVQLARRCACRYRTAWCMPVGQLSSPCCF